MRLRAVIVLVLAISSALIVASCASSSSVNGGKSGSEQESTSGNHPDSNRENADGAKPENSSEPKSPDKVDGYQEVPAPGPAPDVAAMQAQGFGDLKDIKTHAYTSPGNTSGEPDIYLVDLNVNSQESSMFQLIGSLGGASSGAVTHNINGKQVTQISQGADACVYMWQRNAQTLTMATAPTCAALDTFVKKLI